jgi:hypothetical protein
MQNMRLYLQGKKEEQTSSKHRRLRLRYAQQGFAPVPAARLVTATKENQGCPDGCAGTSVSPLTRLITLRRENAKTCMQPYAEHALVPAG